jgi:hypothetical protein
MYKFGWKAIDAFEHCRAKRWQTSPNENFSA